MINDYLLVLPAIVTLTEPLSPSVSTELMAPAWLAHMWFVILCVLLCGYAILDGFDLGVGIIHFLIGRTARERAISSSVIGPVWDGNEVWLVTIGGALFAAFPLAYGTIFSAYMVPLTIVLFCLILRATSLEFRGKAQGRFLIGLCDLSFCLASLIATFIFGVAIGSLMSGIPINEAGTLILPADDSTGHIGLLSEITFALDWFTVTSGLLAVSLFALHGAVFLNLKLSGYLLVRLRKLFPYLYVIFIFTYLAATILAFAMLGKDRLLHPSILLIAILNAAAIANIGREMHRKSGPFAFTSSSLTIAALICLFGISIHPNLVISTINPAWNILATDAASTRATLLTLTVVVCFAIPFVLLYTAITYWTFRDRVVMPDESAMDSKG